MAQYKGLNKDESGNILLPIAANSAPVETTLTASQAYAVGEYFQYSNNLYQVTSAIASGGTITIGTNCTLVPSLGAEISKLNSRLTAVEEGQVNTKCVLKGGVFFPWYQGQKAFYYAYDSDGSWNVIDYIAFGDIKPTIESECAKLSFIKSATVSTYGGYAPSAVSITINGGGYFIWSSGGSTTSPNQMSPTYLQDGYILNITAGTQNAVLYLIYCGVENPNN